MISADTLKKIRRVELKTRRLVNNAFAGAYHAVFKGRGIAFDSVRPYNVGDDVRDIDWNVTARIGEPYIKRYVEERELTVMIVVDASASIFFGTQHQQKRDIAAELGAVLALSAITNNDKVGLLLFSDKIETYIPPRKGRKHVLRLIRELLATEPVHTGTDLTLAVRSVSQMLKRRAIVFLISDFLLDTSLYARDLMVLGRKHDLIAVTTVDPLEQQFPDVGLIRLKDAETQELYTVDSSLSDWRKKYQKRANAFYAERDQILIQAQADRIDLPPDGDYVRALSLFFRKRSQRLKR